jgi:hypothetical protein
MVRRSPTSPVRAEWCTFPVLIRIACVMGGEVYQFDDPAVRAVAEPFKILRGIRGRIENVSP